jgi:hypothetical protein
MEIPIRPIDAFPTDGVLFGWPIREKWRRTSNA